MLGKRMHTIGIKICSFIYFQNLQLMAEKESKFIEDVDNCSFETNNTFWESCEWTVMQHSRMCKHQHFAPTAENQLMLTAPSKRRLFQLSEGPSFSLRALQKAERRWLTGCKLDGWGCRNVIAEETGFRSMECRFYSLAICRSKHMRCQHLFVSAHGLEI